MPSRLTCTAAALTACSLLTLPLAQSTTRASVSSAGIETNFTNRAPAISANGRIIAFDSDATNLVPNDTNNSSDVFVRDTQTNLTTRVSVSSAGSQGDAGCSLAALSADGRYVAFCSFASNLVPGDTNGVQDVFVHDRQAAQTTRVSVSTGGAQGGSSSFSPSLSSDGRYVAFWSYASNLVTGDTNGWADVFVRDRQTGQTTRVSVDSFGAEADFGCNSPSISADGRYVAFDSGATNLAPGDDPPFFYSYTDVFVHDRQTAQTTRVSMDSNGVKGISASLRPSISADGRYVAFQSDSALVAADTNNAPDVYVHDRMNATTQRVSVVTGGAQADYNSAAPAISADGRYVSFTSLATNLVPGDTNNVIDVFVHDRATTQTKRVSVGAAAVQANNGSGAPAISSDGRYVAFESAATNLVALDFNQQVDVFVRDSGVITTWTSLGFGLAGANGVPQLAASGALAPSSTTTFQISGAASTAVGACVLGTTNLSLPIFGGVLVPDALLLLSLVTNASGQAQKQVAWPATPPSGLSVFAQTWLLDAAGVQGFAATNALTATAP